MDCSICANDDIPKEKFFQCPFPECRKEACGECFLKLFKSKESVACVFCLEQLNRVDLFDFFGKSFIDNEYKTYRNKFLFDKEISKKNYVKTLISKKKFLDKVSSDYYDFFDSVKRFGYLSISSGDLFRPFDHPERNRRLDNYLGQKAILQKHKEVWKTLVDEDFLEKYRDDSYAKLFKFPKNHYITDFTTNLDGKIIQDKKDKFYGFCCSHTCEGILNKESICTICSIKVCKKCNQQKKKNHECDPDEVLSVQEAKKNSVECPECHIRIQKVSGCYQMFCTNCHNGFDWGTGKKISKKRLHNPHYFEWLAQKGNTVTQNELNIRCGGEIMPYPVRGEFHSVRDGVHIYCEFATFFNEMIRYSTHIQDVLVNRKYRSVIVKDEIYKLTYIKKLIDEEYTEDDVKKNLSRNEKKIEKACEISNIFSLIHEQIDHSLMTVQKKVTDDYSIKTIKKGHEELINSVVSIVKFGNDRFNRIRQIYGGKAPYLMKFQIDFELFKKVYTDISFVELNSAKDLKEFDRKFDIGKCSRNTITFTKTVNIIKDSHIKRTKATIL